MPCQSFSCAAPESRLGPGLQVQYNNTPSVRSLSRVGSGLLDWPCSPPPVPPGPSPGREEQDKWLERIETMFGSFSKQQDQLLQMQTAFLEKVDVQHLDMRDLLEQNHATLLNVLSGCAPGQVYKGSANSVDGVASMTSVASAATMGVSFSSENNGTNHTLEFEIFESTQSVAQSVEVAETQELPSPSTPDEPDTPGTESAFERLAGYLPWSSATKADKHWVKHIYRKSGFIQKEVQHNFVTRHVASAKFKYFVTGAIIVNSIFVGIEVHTGMQRALDGATSSDDSAMEVFNLLFNLIFAVELSLRIAAYRVHFFLGEEWQWNMFDSFIVLSAIVDYALSGVNGLSSLRTLRALRVAKALRIVRVVTVFRNLQLILNSLVNSLLSLIWMLMLLLLALYLVTIVFMGAAYSYIVDEASNHLNGDPNSLLGDDMSYDQMKDAFYIHFRSIPRGMLTMFFTVTGGIDWYDVARPLMGVSWVYAFVFVGFQIFVVFGIFNVLNAVFVESVLGNRDKDILIQNEQNKTKVFMRDLADLFNEGDTNGDHGFSMAELEAHCTNPRFCAYLNSHSLDASDADTLFEFLDRDGSGFVDVEEFVLGAMKLKGPARCLDMVKTQACFKRLHEQVSDLQLRLGPPPRSSKVPTSLKF